jgi:hypothetical protein
VSVDLQFIDSHLDQLNLCLSIFYGYRNFTKTSVNFLKATLKLGTKSGTGGCDGGGETSN